MKTEKAFQLALNHLLTETGEEIAPDSTQTRRSVVDLFSPNHGSAVKKIKSVEAENTSKSESDS